MNTDATHRCAKLRYRSWRRGTREMDLLLGRFADAHLKGFNARALDSYEALLDLPDPDLYAWITGARAMPKAHRPDVSEVMEAVRRFYAKDKTMG